jgi:hypothetical protein
VHVIKKEEQRRKRQISLIPSRDRSAAYGRGTEVTYQTRKESAYVHDVANSGNLLPTFRDNLSVPSSGNYNADVYSAEVRCSVYNIDRGRALRLYRGTLL